MDKGDRFLLDVVDSLEEISASGKEGTSIKTKATFVGVSGGIALATVLEHKGFLSWLRLVFGSILVRYRHPGLVNLED